jgi:hypothetical protein
MGRIKGEMREKGKTNLSVEYLKKICDGLDI